MKSNFDNDLVLENEIAKFLDELFYPWLLENNGKINSYKRLYDRHSQMKGIDITIDVLDEQRNINKTYNVDEKSTSHYLNQRIPTFAFELSYCNNNESKAGWLLDNNKETHIYALIWPDLKGYKYDNLVREHGYKQIKWQEHIRHEDFSSMEIWMISKSSLLSFIESKYGLSINRLYEINNTIRMNYEKNNSIAKDYSKLLPTKEYQFTYTNYLKEKPINLVLWKNIFKSIARKYLIYEGYVINLNNL